MGISVRDLAEAAVASRLLAEEGLESLSGWGRMPLDRFVDAACRAGRFPPAALYRALAELRTLPFVEGDLAEPSLADARRLPEVLLRRALVLPVLAGDDVVLASPDPDDRQTLATARRMLGREVGTAVAEPAALRRGADRVLRAMGRRDPVVETSHADDAVALLDHVMQEAWLRRASDVHIEPCEAGTRVRLRIDGQLQSLMEAMALGEAIALLTRVKVLAGLDIAEQRAPQDGSFTYRVTGSTPVDVDIRAATIPTRLGERATLRLLGHAAESLSLPELGMSAEVLEGFRARSRRPHGIVLLCGPTGSGKSTTLNAVVRELNRPEVNIVSVEDPIEYTVDGLSQVDVGRGERVTFASALRSILRHDPDVVVVGEIRDGETADIALKAAMTGHLVLSTLHTNDAPGATTRLLDLGCEPYRMAAALTGVVAQRLVRRLCQRCRTTRPATENERNLLGAAEEAFEVSVPVGCALCMGRGFRGRTGLFEYMPVDASLTRLLAAGSSEGELRAQLGPRLRTLRDDGRAKVRAGITSVEEVLRATLGDDA